MSRSNPWSHKIDYAKAIAEDEREIALYDSPAVKTIAASLDADELRWLKEGVCPQDNPYWLLLNGSDEKRTERLTVFGLTEVDLACAAFYNGDSFPVEIACRCVSGGPDFRRGREVVELLKDIPVLTEQNRLRFLKQSKASLARHKRNQIKYGELR